MADISQQEWVSKLEEDDNAFILDVRTDDEVADGYIAKSKQIDIYLGQGFIDELEKLDKSKNYYIYCRSGNRSGKAAEILKDNAPTKGYRNIIFYDLDEHTINRFPHEKITDIYDLLP